MEHRPSLEGVLGEVWIFARPRTSCVKFDNLQLAQHYWDWCYAWEKALEEEAIKDACGGSEIQFVPAANTVSCAGAGVDGGGTVE